MPMTMATLVKAAECLGWLGEVVGPVYFGGARCWAVAQVPPATADDQVRARLRLAGCLFAGSNQRDLLQEASLVAAYAPRAVLIPERGDLTPLMVDAVFLDQGVVVHGSNGVRLLANAGPRVAQGPISQRERGLLDAVCSAWKAARAVSTTERHDHAVLAAQAVKEAGSFRRPGRTRRPRPLS
jgi:hypothetical protein